MFGRLRGNRFDAVPSEADRPPEGFSRDHVNDIVVNLARRSQSLVERQLKVLEELESGEKDPDRLAALHKLEHLTARMRRTNENLLVLGGSSARRRVREPVPLAALVLAAVAENDQYQRVRAEVEDGLDVTGLVAADLVHILAELLDNAVAYSPPTSVVRVTGRRTAAGGAITIADEGIGVREGVLADLNAILEAPPTVDAEVTERMGLVVVGHLAARHGVKVRLSDAAPGVRVTLHLPAEILVRRPQAPAPEDTVRLTPKAPGLEFLDGEATMRLTFAEQPEEKTVLLPTRTPLASLPATVADAAPKHAEPAPEPVLTRLYDALRGDQA
jgi:two-component sensor histidine kinase